MQLADWQETWVPSPILSSAYGVIPNMSHSLESSAFSSMKCGELDRETEFAWILQSSILKQHIQDHPSYSFPLHVSVFTLCIGVLPTCLSG